MCLPVNPPEGRCIPDLLQVERGLVPLAHALRQAKAGAELHVLLCVTVPGVLCLPPQPSLGIRWVTPHLHNEISTGSEQTWVVRYKVQACCQEYKAACAGFHSGVLALSCAEQLEFSFHESTSLAFSGLLPLLSL